MRISFPKLMTLTCLVSALSWYSAPVSGQITTSGEVTPTYDGSDPWEVPTIEVGFNGMGAIEVAGGSEIVTTLDSINHQFRLGGTSGGSGRLTVSDMGSQVTATGLLTVGSSGSGQVVIENGGLVTSMLEARIGSGAGSTGTVTVQGSGSIFQQTSQDTSNDRLKVGVWGTGTINVVDGGLLQTGRVGMGDSNFALQSMGSGTINVSGVGSTWELAGPLNLGLAAGEGIVTVSDGATVENMGFARVIRVGDAGGSTGSITVDGEGSRWVGGASWNLGRAVGGGDASVRVESGGRIEAGAMSVSAGSGRTAKLTVTGLQSVHEGTSLNVTGFGESTVDVSNGGWVQTQFGQVGSFAGSDGTVNVDGPAARFDINETFSVGGTSSAAGGNGTLNITGGHVTVGDELIIWGGGEVNLFDGSLTVGSVNQSADGAALNLLGGVFKAGSIGGDFSFDGGKLAAGVVDGDLIQSGGILAPGDSPGMTTITGDYLLSVGSAEFELAGLISESEFDKLLVQGDAILSGIIDVNLIEGFAPNLNDSFQIIDASSISGTWTFDFSDATLGSGLSWNTGQFASTGAISVVAVPEPGSATFLSFVSILGLSCRRGRRSVSTDCSAGVAAR